jgi:DNA primase
MSSEIDEIKSKLDIVEFVSEYLRLTPAGANFKANCPFHNEKTPSFMVNRERGIWRCFGCGEGGDALEFLMKMENIPFPEALKVLAQRTGVTLTRERQEVNTGKNRLYDLCLLAANYWHKVLLDSPCAVAVRDYLAGRGLSEETIDDFKIGYAIESWDNLLQFLLKRGYGEQEIAGAGLIVRKNQGSGYYDRFRDRVMFPIWDYHGRVVGFGGRALKSDETAKYINTPQSEIYNKSEVLYGLYQAKQEIKKADLTILVEGYMDVIPSHQAGIKNVVSISGTALTDGQIRILKRYSSNLAIALDRDEAGRVAALRSIDLALQLEMNVRVISVPFGKDPGECVKNNSADWVQAIGEAKEAMEYFFTEAREGKDPSNSADRKAIVKFMLEKILRLGSEVDRDFWIKRVAQDLSISEPLLREAYGRLRPSRLKNTAAAAAKPEAKPLQADWETSVFQRLLSLLIIRPQFLPHFIDKLSAEAVSQMLPLTIYKKLVLFYNNNTDLLNPTVVDNSGIDLFVEFDKWLKTQENQADLADYWSNSYLLSQEGLPGLGDREIKTELDNLIGALHLAYINKKINRLKDDLAPAEQAKDQAKIKEIYDRLNDLISQKNKLT